MRPTVERKTDIIDHVDGENMIADAEPRMAGILIVALEGAWQPCPNTNPATIDLNFDKALEWLQKGAQPTDTCRAILSYKGVMYKKHLLGGVAKGAFDEAAADAKFEKWMSEKAAKISAKTQKLTGEKEKSEKARLAAEKEANEKKAKAIEAKRAEAAAAAAAQTEEAEAPAEGEAPAAE